MQLEFVLQFHPLTSYASLALIAFLLGIQAAIGANVGLRRGLNWQTGFLLGLIFGGPLVALLYSIRPLSAEPSYLLPKWISQLYKWPLAVTSLATSILAIVMEFLASAAPVVALNSPWSLISWLGLLLAISSIPSFIALGARMGELWFEMKDRVAPEGGIEEQNQSTALGTS